MGKSGDYLKDINIGRFVAERIVEIEMKHSRITKYLKCSEDDLQKILNSNSLDSDLFLRLSKILKFDFFRLYTQHLIFYAPSSSLEKNKNLAKTSLPQFRKNIYTKEVIDFILNLVRNNEKTKTQIIEEYGIPKTTLYKWLNKY